MGQSLTLAGCIKDAGTSNTNLYAIWESGIKQEFQKARTLI